jgi:hypothetical protein
MAPPEHAGLLHDGADMPTRARSVLRSLIAASALAGLGACAQLAELSAPDPAATQTAQESYDYCQQGATCILKPMAMLVLNKTNSSVNFDYRSWMLYDPRTFPLGQRYVALMNDANDPVCEGYYVSVGFVNAPTVLSCFPREAYAKGTLRFHTAQQQEGPFTGKSTGTGVFETDKETVLIVHGATPEENRSASFKDIWDKYGGGWQREVTSAEASAKRIPDLPRLVRSNVRRTPVSASVGSR